MYCMCQLFFTTNPTILCVHSEYILAAEWFPSWLILLSSVLQRARSPRVPASVCLCLEASNNCSSPPPSLFVSYRGSAPSVLPIPPCLEGTGSNRLNAMRLHHCQTCFCYSYWKRTVVALKLLKPQDQWGGLLKGIKFEVIELWRVACGWSRLLAAPGVQWTTLNTLANRVLMDC